MSTLTLHKRGGWALFEIMLTIAFFAAFVVVAAKTLRTSLRVSQNVGAAASVAVRLDGAVDRLRSDVWGAKSLAAPDARTLKIERSDEAAITWTITEQGGLVRSTFATDDAKEQWSNVAPGMTFEVSGAIVSLIEPLDGDDDGLAVKVPLVSQLAVANRGQP